MGLMGIAGLVVALGYGIYAGLPRRYDQPLSEIDERLEKEGQHGKVRRRTTFLNLMQRKMQKGSDRRMTRGRRRPFSS